MQQLMKVSLKNGARVVNTTAFGRAIAQLGRSHEAFELLNKYDFPFGFQDGGCLMFASALKTYLEEHRSHELMKVELHAITELDEESDSMIHHHVVVTAHHAQLGYLCFDSDGMGTVAEQIIKFELIESPTGQDCAMTSEAIHADSPVISSIARNAKLEAELLALMRSSFSVFESISDPQLAS